MHLFDAPHLECQAFYDPKLSLGGRQLLRLQLQGWGRLRVRTENRTFTAYFWGEKRWDLLIPQGSVVQVEARNFLGARANTLVLRKAESLRSDDEFLQSIQPAHREFARSSSNYTLRLHLVTASAQFRDVVSKVPLIGLRIFDRLKYTAPLRFQKLRNLGGIKMTTLTLESADSTIGKTLIHIK